MKENDCIALLRKAKALPELVAAARSVGHTTGADAEVKAAWEVLRSHLAANDHKPAVQPRWHCCGWTPDDTVRRFRKGGPTPQRAASRSKPWSTT